MEGAIYSRKRMPRFHSFRAEDKELPLLSRGWVYQEMALSTRVLHCTAQEIIWQCRGGRKSESGSNDRDASDVELVRDSIASGRAMDQPWWDIVRDYTALGLTQPTDKLPGLSAIALRAAKGKPGDGYLFGLWRNTLLEDLL